MIDCMSFEGIETNNLKNIDVTLKRNALNLIIGPSGSGKSSLAYDTIASLAQHEFMAMFADSVSEPLYRVKKFSGLNVTIPIKQSNLNNNLRSTIGTYYGLNRYVALIYAVLLKVPEERFTLNNGRNCCPKCHGLGFLTVLDENRIIDYNIPICKNPFKCWNKYKDFYSQILINYCSDEQIDARKTFRELTAEEKQKLLYGESDKKYSIRYKKTNSYSRRTTKYFGSMSEKPMMVHSKIGVQFYTEHECEICSGEKYSKELEQFKVLGFSIGNFMKLAFTELQPVLQSLHNKQYDEQLKFAIRKLHKFIDKAIELKLGYLSLHRSIPSLSGGEFQRLKLVQVFTSHLHDLLIVLDEPLAGISGEERTAIYHNIISLSKQHTLLVVDHSDFFVKEAKTILALGPEGGKKGGYLIDWKNYLKIEAEKHYISIKPVEKERQIQIINRVYQYLGVNIKIAINRLNLIYGASGVGKSTLLREYLPQFLNSYQYVNQKPLVGNVNSNVATLLDIMKNISKLFAKSTDRDSKFFSNLTGSEGACPVCNGAGSIEYGYDMRTKMRVVCEECEGTGFNKELKKYKINNKNIFDIWRMTIEEAVPFFIPLDKKIVTVLNEACSIMLGHLQIGQLCSTLSGGENIRIKLLRVAHSNANTIGLDEPFRGLSSSEIFKVISFVSSQFLEKGKTIIVVDHAENAMHFFDRRIELICQDGFLVANNNE